MAMSYFTLDWPKYLIIKISYLFSWSLAKPQEWILDMFQFLFFKWVNIIHSLLFFFHFTTLSIFLILFYMFEPRFIYNEIWDTMYTLLHIGYALDCSRHNFKIAQDSKSTVELLLGKRNCENILFETQKGFFFTNNCPFLSYVAGNTS